MVDFFFLLFRNFGVWFRVAVSVSASVLTAGQTLATVAVEATLADTAGRAGLVHALGAGVTDRLVPGAVLRLHGA